MVLFGLNATCRQKALSEIYALGPADAPCSDRQGFFLLYGVRLLWNSVQNPHCSRTTRFFRRNTTGLPDIPHLMQVMDSGMTGLRQEAFNEGFAGRIRYPFLNMPMNMPQPRHLYELAALDPVP